MEDGIVKEAGGVTDAGQQVVSGCKLDVGNFARICAGGVVTFQQRHFVPGAMQMIGQADAELAGGEIREAPDFVQFFVGWTAGDEAAHKKTRLYAGRKRRVRKASRKNLVR